MNTDKINELGAEWTELDNTYDAIIQNLIDNPEPLTPEKQEEIKSMQTRLYNLETELFDNLNK